MYLRHAGGGCYSRGRKKRERFKQACAPSSKRFLSLCLRLSFSLCLTPWNNQRHTIRQLQLEGQRSARRSGPAIFSKQAFRRGFNTCVCVCTLSHLRIASWYQTCDSDGGLPPSSRPQWRVCYTHVVSGAQQPQCDAPIKLFWITKKFQL